MMKKLGNVIIRITLLALTALLICTSFTSCVATLIDSIEPPALDYEGETVYPEYLRLYEAQKELYSVIAYGISEGYAKIELGDAQEYDVGVAYNAVYKDNPQFFNMTNGYNYTISSSFGRNDITLEPTYVAQPNNNEEKRKELDGVVSAIVAEAQTYPDDYSKVLFVHDYIVNNTTYDKESADAVTLDPYAINDSSTAYGCLVNNYAICSGYSAAFQLVMQELGILCGRTDGQKIGGPSHQWNYIELDGECYYVDVTWDDPVSITGDKSYLSYEYFCITTEELQLTHVIQDSNVPECTADKYNYYVYNNLYIGDYSFDAVRPVIEENIFLENGVSLKFSSAEELKKAIDDLFEQDRIFDISAVAQAAQIVNYYEGTGGCILTIKLKTY